MQKILDLLYKIILKGVVEHKKQDRSFGGQFCYDEMNPEFRIGIHLAVSIYQIFIFFKLRMVFKNKIERNEPRSNIFICQYVLPVKSHNRVLRTPFFYNNIEKICFFK